MIEGVLRYNSVNGRYGLIVSGSWRFSGFCCGETLEVYLGGKWVPSRMEMAWTNQERYWYLVDTPFFRNLDGIRVRR